MANYAEVTRTSDVNRLRAPALHRRASRQVRLGSTLSIPFPVERGIRQGSVLSPTIFNLVIDPLLSDLESRDVGLRINGLFLGAFAQTISALPPRTLMTYQNKSTL